MTHPQNGRRLHHYSANRTIDKFVSYRVNVDVLYGEFTIPTPRKKRQAKPITELEGAVLGNIAVKGPCTPYAVRREFLASATQYWSASSGAIYPLIRRLAGRGLIHVRKKNDDGRHGKLCMLTAAGSRTLNNWLATLDSTAAISLPPDPVRTRIGFFAILDPARRKALLARAMRKMSSYLSQFRAYTEQAKANKDKGEYLARVGAQRMLEARLQWLQDVARSQGDEENE
jgi:DNA-binding PadR family transcriptional regulator